jgi:hypothetical protein
LAAQPHSTAKIAISAKDLNWFRIAPDFTARWTERM